MSGSYVGQSFKSSKLTESLKNKKKNEAAKAQNKPLGQKGRKLTSPMNSNTQGLKDKPVAFFNKRDSSPQKNAAVLATNGSNPNLANVESSGASYSASKFGNLQSQSITGSGQSKEFPDALARFA